MEPERSGKARAEPPRFRKEHSMRKPQLALLLSLLAATPALWAPARAQTPVPPQLLYAAKRQILIPFDPDPNEAHRVKQLQLYYSLDQGRSWRIGATAAPEQRKFNFLAEGDGLYYFAVQTTDQAGRTYPEKLENLTAALRVVIDTQPPAVSLKALPGRGNEVGVSWEIRDDNFDPANPQALSLEYRPMGTANWIPLLPGRGAVQHYWTPATVAAVEVRLRARDLAGNVGEGSTQVTAANPGAFTNPGTGVYDPAGQFGSPYPPLDPDRRFLNNKRISLSYDISEKGPSGIADIDLWFTTDARSWSKWKLPKSVHDQTFNGKLTFEVGSEGVYGFTLVPISGVGISAPHPQVGEKPQIWIEVDLTRPVVELQRVDVGQGQYKGQLSITWSARDKNLGKTPITLSYGTSSNGPWVPFAPKIQNTGRYVWTMPIGSDMPWQFYVKVEAEDLAGNIGEAITPGVVRVDTQQPKARILDVQSGGH
jgi:hypothetical protein